MSSSPPRKRYLSWLRDLALLLGVVLAVQWWQARDMPRGEAPPLAGAALDGRPMSLQAHAGAPVLVHFWATWCPICRFEDGSIDNLADDYQVITVASTSGNAQEIAEYLEEQGVDFPVLLDESGDLARLWDVVGVPATFIVDSRGRIDYATRGYSSELGLRVRLALSD